MELDILFQDEEIVAINKPHGLLVHRSPIASDVQVFALQILREQLGTRVYPVHRLDRKTAGVLLFTLTRESLINLSNQFIAGTVSKKYLAIVRGYTPESGVIDYPLVNDAGKCQEAVTRYRTLGLAEIPYSLGKHSTQRYSLVLAEPETGRKHQIRKHFSHIFHPIIADRPNGCNKQNKFFKEVFEMDTMMLHAHQLFFAHPAGGRLVEITAPLGNEFLRMLTTLHLDQYFKAYEMSK